MTISKPIPFQQVRVRTDLDGAGSYAGGRVSAPARPAAVFQWNRLNRSGSEPEPEPAPDLESQEDPEGHEAVSVAPHALSARGMPQAPPPPKDPVRQGETAQPELQSALRDPSQAPPQEQARPGRAPVKAEPVTAIARSVRQAAVMHGLSDTIMGLCDGEENQRLGPWDMTLPLDCHGLGKSSLNLRLSVGELLLRFQCDGAAVLDLVSSGAERLSSQLQEALRPALEVRIEMALN